MRAFQRSEASVSPAEILEMVTVNAAGALSQQSALGRIRPGFHADFTSVPCRGLRDVFEEIVAFEQPVESIMTGGVNAPEK